MADDIKTPAQASVAESSGGDCKLCLKKPSRYTCPRCNVRYCSMECYKSPSHEQCSELFYRDLFMEGLKEMKPDSKQQMMDILQRQAHMEKEEAEVEDLGDRLKGIDITKDTPAVWDIVWDKLTAAQKSQFQSLVRDGEMGKLLEAWTSWWDQANLVTSADSHDPSACIVETPTLTSLLRGKAPSDEIPFSIVNVLYGYCYMCRLYNGDHASFGEDVCEGLLTLCCGLGQGRLASTSDALHACLFVLADEKNDLTVSRSFSTAVIQDVCKVVAGRDDSATWIAAALSDVHRVFTSCRKELRRKLKRMDISSPACQKLKEKRQAYFGTLKKIEFFLSYVQAHGEKVKGVLPDIEVAYCTMESTLVQTHPKGKQSRAESVSDNAKNLIEEVN